MAKKATKEAIKEAPTRRRAAKTETIKAVHDSELDSGIKIRCRHTELKDIDSLVPFPRNPNTHTPEQIKLLSKIIKHSGWRNPIVVSLRSGFVTKGHGRLEAAKLLREEMGETQVPVEYQSYDTEADEVADIVADNKITELSVMDADVTLGLAKEVQMSVPDFDFDVFGGFVMPDFSHAEEVKEGTTTKAKTEKEAPEQNAILLTYPIDKHLRLLTFLREVKKKEGTDSVSDAMWAACEEYAKKNKITL